MLIYIFASDTRPRVSAFTADQTGGNLPADYAPWRSINGGKAVSVGSITDPVAVAVRRDGFFLLSGKARISSGDQTKTGRDV
jgi:hypothetical protein